VRSTLTGGLVLIAGRTGSGKTTTVAALIDDTNDRDARHIVDAARQGLATALAAVLTQTLIPRPLGTRCERGAPSRAPS
jgi:Tfp pilus assembly pilus retraction ATPase PilT